MSIQVQVKNCRIQVRGCEAKYVVTRLSILQFLKLYTQQVSQPIWKKLLTFKTYAASQMAGLRIVVALVKTLLHPQDELAGALPGALTEDSGSPAPTFWAPSYATTSALTPVSGSAPGSTDEFFISEPRRTSRAISQSLVPQSMLQEVAHGMRPIITQPSHQLKPKVFLCLFSSRE